MCLIDLFSCIFPFALMSPFPYHDSHLVPLIPMVPRHDSRHPLSNSSPQRVRQDDEPPALSRQPPPCVDVRDLPLAARWPPGAPPSPPVDFYVLTGLRHACQAVRTLERALSGDDKAAAKVSEFALGIRGRLKHIMKRLDIYNKVCGRREERA